MYSSGRVDELMFLLEGHREDGTNGQDKTCVGAATSGNTVASFVKTACGTENNYDIAEKTSDIGQAAADLSEENTDPEATAGSNCKITADLVSDYDSHETALPLLGGLLTIHNGGGFKSGQTIKTAATTNKLISALKNKGAGVAESLKTVTSAAPTNKQELKTLLASKGERAKLQAANDEYNNWKPGANLEDFDAHIQKVFGAEDGKDSAYAIAREGISIEVPHGAGKTESKQLYSMQPKDLMAALIGTIAELQTAAAKKPACPDHQQKNAASDALCSKIKDANGMQQQAFLQL
uniref:Variant surface glycoprotein n=1 Tax=Trypanosoma brucei TaxID=5691 RepID=A0A1V0FZ57_9TRYP|nr:variant surface glycoprotein [Trypanosoma brucei]